MTFDKLSRPLTRTEPGASATWVWGASAAAHNIGALASISTSGHSESFTYDTKGRLSQRSIVSDASYLINYAYDATTGLLDSLQYPTSTSAYRLKLKYNYQYGVLQKVSDFAVPATVFWQGVDADARGNVIDETLGHNGSNPLLKRFRGFDGVTGLPDYIQVDPYSTSTPPPPPLQNLEFLWNKVGSLSQRRDVKRSLTEVFEYDDLHRLDYSRLNGTLNLDLSYDSMGNIAYKDDVGSYDYGTPQAGCNYYSHVQGHAVRKAGSTVYCYDANGNQISRNGENVTWTSYNYPSHVPNGTQYHDYFYAADRQRWKQVYYNGTASETTIFVGGILEKHTANGITEYRHTITAGDQPVALYTRPSSGTITTQYFLLDHLGSVAEITNSLGLLDVAENFAAFGERRDPTDWSGPPSAADKTAIAGITQRGYTFHTNAEESSLIHMNGRIADARTGRFLSPDPYVFQPELTQSFNRYSYVNNNPLTFTDSSGFCIDPYFNCAGTIIGTVFSFAKKLFGRKKKPPPPPKGCLFGASAGGCYGKAAATKLFDIARDIYGLPPLRASSVWGVGDGRFGSGPCAWGPGCMSLDEIEVANPEADARVDVSRAIESGILNPHGVWTSPGALARDVLRVLDRITDKRGIEIGVVIFNPSKDVYTMGEIVYGDEGGITLPKSPGAVAGAHTHGSDSQYDVFSRRDVRWANGVDASGVDLPGYEDRPLPFYMSNGPNLTLCIPGDIRCNVVGAQGYYRRVDGLKKAVSGRPVP